MIDWAAGSGWCQAGGHRLEWRVAGPSPKEASTIVLLHEGLGSVSLWRNFPDRLAQETGCGVFAFSRAGYGQSDVKDLPWSVDYMTREATVVLPEVLKALSAPDVILFGHSDGGTIAALHAALAPAENIRAIILLAPHLFAEAIALQEIARAQSVYETDLRQRLARHHRDPDVAFGGWAGAWLHPDFATWDQRHIARHITCPVLALQGKQDQYGSAEQVLLYADLCPGDASVHLLDACRHAPHQDQPEIVLDHTKLFLKALNAQYNAQ